MENITVYCKALSISTLIGWMIAISQYLSQPLGGLFFLWVMTACLIVAYIPLIALIVREKRRSSASNIPWNRTTKLGLGSSITTVVIGLAVFFYIASSPLH